MQTILPRKLKVAAEYAERATLSTDLMVLARTAWLLLRRSIERGAAS